jgi:GntR family transcriptional repressor for pyruvate dehydrogenase complex
MLRPIEKKNLPKEIIRQIMSEVRSGNLKQGDRLPPERELGLLFNVGRSSIREALKVLEAVGTVRRTKEGTTLCTPGEVEDQSIWLGGCCAEIHEVFETRKLIEVELAGLAAERATPDDIKKIQEAMEMISDIKLIRTSDVAFHRAIVEAAKNSVFSQVYNLVTGLLFHTYDYYSLVGEFSLKDIVEQHTKIMKTIASHNPQKTREAMRHHLDRAESTLISTVQENLPDL